MNTQIYQEAGDWLVKHREDDLPARDKAAFDAWLRESPHHLRAYLEMSSLWEDMGALQPDSGLAPDAPALPAASELLAQLRAEANVIALNAAPSASRGRQATRKRAHAWGAVAASVCLSMTAAWVYVQRNTYSTDIGEQRVITLDDGSRIDLNVHSRLKVRFDDRVRSIELLQGQALFKVEKDAARPFVVKSGGVSVRAIGTQFDVYRKKTGTVVTVIEGKVAVSSSSPLPLAGEGRVRVSSEVIPLSAGRQLTIRPMAPAPTATVADLTVATAWTRRNLVFDDAPLSEVAEEFNRYNPRQIVITNPGESTFHVSGVFSSSDPSVLLKFLRAQPEISVDETGSNIRIAYRQGDGVRSR